jgi:hypothetical protein
MNNPLTNPPPLLPPQSIPQPASGRQFLSALLSLCLGLFLADAAISLADDSIALATGVHFLFGIRIIVGLFAVLLALLIYVLMAFVPAIPKRCFVPLALFYLASQLAAMPMLLLYYAHQQLIAWMISLAQVGLGLWLLHQARHGLTFGWPLVSPAMLGSRRFNWRNLIRFGLGNCFGLLPAVTIYLFFCTAGLVHHFTDGFMTLHPRGFTVQVRKYVRADGKTIQLFPMSHVAEADFYQGIANTFPTNSLILMEGVTDENHLLQHKINYQRMANTLGLAEQHEKFAPTRGEIVQADIDVNQFTTNTRGVLNLVIVIHSGGMQVATLHQLLQYSSSPVFLEQLLDDLLRKRNAHLLAQIQTHLSETEHIIVPWGVAHMPGLANEIQRAGFHLQETKDYEVIRFHFAGIRFTP